MKIRRATNADISDIKELVFGVLRDYGLKPDPDSTDRDLDDLETHYFKNQGWFCVLECENRVVGSYGLFRVTDTMCELRKMYLDPKYRGKGYGKALLEDALRRASELGYKLAFLETASVLKEAIALYVKYGFEPYQPKHLSPRCDQAYITKLN
jgi:putative acetyltransferase